MKQLMTPAYMAPELLGDDECYNKPSKASDVYSLGILGYEVIFCLSLWKRVSIDLIDQVKLGHRPPFPDNTPEKCWQHSHVLRPPASEVSGELEHYMECKVHSEITSVYSESVTETLVIADNNDAVMQDGYEGITQEMLDGSQQFGKTVVCVDADQVTLSSPNSVSAADVQLVSPIDTRSSDIEHAMGILKIQELKLFLLRCLDALRDGKDVIVVQPTGSSKSVCFTLPAFLSPGKVTLPVVATIMNQIQLRNRCCSPGYCSW